MAKGQVQAQVEIVSNKDPQKEAKKLRRKLIDKYSVKSDNHIADAIISIAGVAIIIPCIFYGMAVFVGSGFKSALEASLKMYNDIMRDAEKWSK